MNTTRPPALLIRGLCLLVLSMLSISCATRPKPNAADWNQLKIWRQVGVNPPTYVPTGYGADQPRTERDGTWFTDQRDGKRLFVPNQATRGMEHGVLLGEAKKVTGHDNKPRLSPGQKAWWGFLAVITAMGRAQLPPPD